MEERIQCIKQSLQASYLYWSLKKQLKAELIKSKYSKDQCRECIPKIVEQQGCKIQLQNEICRLNEKIEFKSKKYAAIRNDSGTILTQGKKQVIKKMTTELGQEIRIRLPSIQGTSFKENEDKLEVVEYARTAWVEFIKEQLLTISKQLNIALATPIIPDSDDAKKKKKKKKKENEFDFSRATSEDIPKYTGVFGPSNVFEVCIKIQNPNHERNFSPNIAGWGLIKLELKPLTSKQIRFMFEELDAENRQIGIDDERREWFYKESIANAKRISQIGYIPDICKFARAGIPIPCRAKMWKQMLHVQSCPKEKLYFETLLKESTKMQYLVDDMIVNDVKRTCDDDNFFVFEENLMWCMRAFSRDPWIKENCTLAPVSLYGLDINGNKVSEYPPSGVIPFEGLSLMCAPITFLYSNPEDVYFVFRNMYVKYFCRLHTVSSEKDSLLSLCKYFEDILQEKDPQLFYHLLQMNVHPLSIAYHWIFHAFAGYLIPEQLLVLWDRILGFDTMYVLPILSAAIFCFRSPFLMKATSQQEVYDIFSDFTVIRSIPLLQLFTMQLSA